MHVEIKGDKIWVQQDGTEDGVAADLLAAGIHQGLHRVQIKDAAKPGGYYPVRGGLAIPAPDKEKPGSHDSFVERTDAVDRAGITGLSRGSPFLPCRPGN